MEFSFFSLLMLYIQNVFRIAFFIVCDIDIFILSCLENSPLYTLLYLVHLTIHGHEYNQDDNFAITYSYYFYWLLLTWMIKEWQWPGRFYPQKKTRASFLIRCAQGSCVCLVLRSTLVRGVRNWRTFTDAARLIRNKFPHNPPVSSFLRLIVLAATWIH
jgi:hypothetical protein